MTTLTRWDWRVVDGPASYRLSVRHFYRPANDDHYPYSEGHSFELEWTERLYGEEGQPVRREKFITEKERRDAPVVDAHGLAGLPFWTERVAHGVTVTVALAKPDHRFSDDPDGGTAFRCSYLVGDQRTFLAPVDMATGGFSKVGAVAMFEEA
jgi:hypothetical protein